MLLKLIRAVIQVLRFALVVWLLLGFFFWIRMVSDYQSPGTLSFLQYLLTVLGAGVMYVLAIAVHEAGHWFSGRALGFIGTRFVVLWLQVERHGARWTVKLAKRPSKLGGLVLQYPSSSRQLRWRKFWSIAAGPGANLLAGLLALAVGSIGLPSVSARPAAGPVILAAELLVFALFSLIMGLTNLMPRRVTPELSNDGHLLWRLWRREPTLSRQLAMMALVGSSYAGLRPREWDGVLLAEALAPDDGSVLDCSALLLNYLHHLDARRPPQARALLYACLDKLDLFPEESQQHLCCEAAYFEACHAQNAAQAQYWLAHAQQRKAFADGDGHFTQAVVAWASGQYATAQTHLQRVEAEPLVTDENDVGRRLLALDRLADLRARCATAPGRLQAVK